MTKMVDILVVATDYATNDSNSSMNEFSSDTYNPYDSPLLKISSVIFVIIGFAATIMNFTIFAILVQKRKKMASELLVVVNLIIDGCYGLMIVLVGTLNITQFNVARFFRIRPLNCIISKVPPTFLTFASLFLVLLIAMNRFMAVKYPGTYKDVFKPRLVRTYLIILFLVSGTMAAVDFGICVADPMGKSSFAEYYSIFWIYAKFSLVTIAAVAMFVVYKLIANQFSRTFWSPIALPFMACCRRNQSVSSGPSESVAKYSHNSNFVSVEMNKSPFANQDDFQNQFQQMGSDDSQKSDKSNHSEPKRKLTNMTVVRFNDDVPADNANIELYSPRTRKGMGSKRFQRRARKALTLQQQKHYVTTIFFFVCFVFLAVSLPNSISHLINHIFADSLSVTFLFNLYLLTETLYGINFVLNPYLFSFNNSYLKERIAEWKIVKKIQFHIFRTETRVWDAKLSNSI